MNGKNKRAEKRKFLPEVTLKLIPPRYVFAFTLTILKFLLIIGVVLWLIYKIRYFYFLVLLTQFVCVIKIISSDTNPDYKVPWLLFVLILPVVGFMLYFVFSKTTLKRKYVKKFKTLKGLDYEHSDQADVLALKQENLTAYNMANLIKKISGANLFTDTTAEYFSSGEEYKNSLILDIKSAEKFIYLEFFIIKKGKFWKEVYDALKEKAISGVEVKIVYDDIGCMHALPTRYHKALKRAGIKAVPFSRLKGEANSDFNNRSHRKIVVIDGKISYTGGINIGDEYINLTSRLGHWKDVGVKLVGGATKELTKLFLIDYAINSKLLDNSDTKHYPSIVNASNTKANGYVIPFGDGPKPLYEYSVGKSVIQAMLYSAKKYAYITTPYLIIDNDTCQTIEDASLRGVKVKIIVPGVPDKKLVNYLTKSYYDRLMKAGVEIYEYEKGFIHAKSYLIDGEYALLGTINLDYRSLEHHFENGVWFYGSPIIRDIEEDFNESLSKSVKVGEKGKKQSALKRIICALLKVFSPLF